MYLRLYRMDGRMDGWLGGWMDGRMDGNICPTEVKLASVNLEKPKDPRWRQLANEPAENTDTGMGTSR